MRRFFIGLGVFAALLVVAVAVAAVLIKPLASTPEPLFTIEHDIEIDASPEEVWAVLTDFAAYPEWNSYALRLEGELELGAPITLTIQQATWSEPLTVYPTLVRLEAPRTLGWHGTLFLEGLHETDHYFEIEPLAQGRSRLHHAEEFRGWLAAKMDREQLRSETRDAFRTMNEALAKRVAAVR